MSESKLDCPFCGRQAAHEHQDICPRSRQHMKNISALRDRIALLRRMGIPLEDPETGDQDPTILKYRNAITAVRAQF